MVEATADQVAKAKNVAFMASRSNTLMSIPMLNEHDRSRATAGSCKDGHSALREARRTRRASCENPVKLSDDLKQSIGQTVSSALREDVGDGDLTASLVDVDAVVGATIIARESLVLAGQPWVDEVFSQLDEQVIIDLVYRRWTKCGSR